MRIIAGQRRGHKFDGPRDRGDPADQRPRPRVDLQHPRRVGRGAARHRPLRRHRRPRPGGPEPGGGPGDLRRAEPRERRPDPPEHRHPPLRGPGPGRHGRRLPLGQVVRPGDAEPVVVFIDPPYPDYEDHPDRVRQAPRRPDRDAARRARSSRPSRAASSTPRSCPTPTRWDVRRYGGTQVAIRTLGARSGADRPASRSRRARRWRRD